MSNFDKQNKHSNISNSNNTTTGSRNSNASTDKTGVSSRSGRSRIAHQTLEILEEGVYVNGYDRAVHIKKDMEQAIQNSVLYRPSELSQLGEKLRKGGNPARMEVTGETTLATAAASNLRGRQNGCSLSEFCIGQKSGWWFPWWKSGSGGKLGTGNRAISMYCPDDRDV